MAHLVAPHLPVPAANRIHVILSRDRRDVPPTSARGGTLMCVAGRLTGDGADTPPSGERAEESP